MAVNLWNVLSCKLSSKVDKKSLSYMGDVHTDFRIKKKLRHLFAARVDSEKAYFEQDSSKIFNGPSLSAFFQVLAII